MNAKAYERQPLTGLNSQYQVHYCSLQKPLLMAPAKMLQPTGKFFHLPADETNFLSGQWLKYVQSTDQIRVVALLQKLLPQPGR